MHVNKKAFSRSSPFICFFHAGTCWVRGGLPVGGVPQEDQEPGRSPLPLPPQGRVQACFQGQSFIYFVMSKYSTLFSLSNKGIHFT